MSKRNFQIFTDSSADMPENYYAENGVTCINLGFTLNGENYLGADGKDITAKDFYSLLREGGMPTTTQVSPQSAKDGMEQALKAGDDVLVIAFSSGLSGTCSSFQVASKELLEEYPDRKIEVVDGLCASMGQGLLLDYVMKKADEGAGLEETRAYAENLKLQICHEFTVDDLFHLRRGGRVSSATAVVGTILKIKPIMHVDNLGKLVPRGKAMGRRKSIYMLSENMDKAQVLEKGEPIFISHGDCLEDAEFLKGILEKKYPENPVSINHVGSVIGAHSGVGTLALFYRGSKREL